MSNQIMPFLSMEFRDSFSRTLKLDFRFPLNPNIGECSMQLIETLLEPLY